MSTKSCCREAFKHCLPAAETAISKQTETQKTLGFQVPPEKVQTHFPTPAGNHKDMCIFESRLLIYINRPQTHKCFWVHTPTPKHKKRQKKNKKIHWHFQVLACFFNRSKALKAELRQLVFSMAWDSGFEGSQPWAFSAAARPQPWPCEGSTRPQPWASSRMQDTRPQPWACIACVLAEAPGRSHGRWPGRSRGQSQLPGRSRGVRRESMHARPQPHNIYIYIISLGKGLYGS